MALRTLGVALVLGFAAEIAAQPVFTAGALGAVTAIKPAGDAVELTVGKDLVRVSFHSPSVARIWVGTQSAGGNDNFTDPAGPDAPCTANPGCVSKGIVIGNSSGVKTTFEDKGTYYEISPGASSPTGVTLRATKHPALTFSMYAGAKLLWKEAAPIHWNTTTTEQSLQAGDSPADAYFFGGGMQNGRFSHKGQKLVLSKNFDWDPGKGGGGHGGGSVPFYLSNAGFGSFRNTWADGTYDFTAPDGTAKLSHNESRFDAYFFAGDFEEVLNSYTQLVGRPFMVPMYGLGLGDSDCYHNPRHANSTRTVIAIADKFHEEEMPGSWFLVNDGYGCGYGEGPFEFPNGTKTFPHDFADLDFVVSELNQRGFVAGLWSSTGLPNIKREVAGSGTRIAKTDVGWIGNGGSQYAFDSVQVVADGIEDNSDARRYIWTVCGWAGTHRNAVMWTGDDSGSFEYIRWQLTTFVGTGFSAQAHVSGDIDGIFGGSPHTYVRDLQFKCLMTTLMSMSGWAANPDKQPWTYGEPYTSINRMYLQLKSALTPYQYTYSRIAAETGMPPVRAMALQFPEDLSTYDNHTGSAYQFMSGDWLLVAPVYRNETTRDGIYLPAGDWYDWWDDTVYQGPFTLDGYDAPLDTLPLFARAGAIIPKIPPMLHTVGNGSKPYDPMTLELYPEGNSSFSLYEDDGVTRQHEDGMFATTEISMSAMTNFSTKRKPDVVVKVSAATGKGFVGQLKERSWVLNVHSKVAPVSVTLRNSTTGDGIQIPELQSVPAVEYRPMGWFFNHLAMGDNKEKAIVYIKLPSMASNQGFEVVLSSGARSDHVGVEACDTIKHHQIQPQKFAHDVKTGLITQVGKTPAMCITVGKDSEVDSHTPALEMQKCDDEAYAGKQSWTQNSAGQFTLTSQPKSCIDTDSTDKMLELYSCHAPASAGNQAFTVDASTGHISAKGSGLCMYVRSG